LRQLEGCDHDELAEIPHAYCCRSRCGVRADSDATGAQADGDGGGQPRPT